MNTIQLLRKSAWMILLMIFSCQVYATDAPVTTAATRTACPGDTVSVPVTATGFNGIAGFQLRIEYDSTVLVFDSALFDSSLPGSMYGSVPVSGNTKKITVVWTGYAPVTLASGSKLFTMYFHYLGDSTALTFNNTSSNGDDCSFYDILLNTLTDTPTSSFYHDGQVSTGQVGGSVTGGSTIYYNTSTGNLTLSGHLGSTLKWQKQYNGGGYTDIPSTSGLTVYSENPLYTGTWDYRAVVQNSPCPAVNSTSTTVTVLTPVGTSKTWTGTASTDWITPTNWSPPGTPVITDDVIIPSGTTYSPEVFITTATCNNLLISSDAALKINLTKNLKVNGTLTIQGP
jgi:hypothetical protein